MTANENTGPSQPLAPKPTPGKLPRWVPPLRNLLFSFTFLSIGLLVWGLDAFSDHAIGKIALWICMFLALLTPLLWFTFHSGHRGLVRWIPLASLVLGLGVPLIAFEIRGVGGEMTPQFGCRWQLRPDQQLAIPSAPVASADVEPPADLNTTTPHDFPKYLGPHGNLTVDGIALARDWQVQPPQPMWKQPIGAGWSAFAVVGGYAVTMEQRKDQELVTCYDVKTGELLWSHGINARYESVLGGVGPRSTPTIDQGRVYAMGATGVLRCLDGGTGTLLWQKDLLKELKISPAAEAATVVYGRSGSPLVVDDLVVVPAGGSSSADAVALIAFDKQTGKEQWRGGRVAEPAWQVESAQISQGSPAVATLGGVRQIISLNEKCVSGHEIDTGKTLWTHPWPGRITNDANASQPQPVGGDRLFLSKSYGTGCALVQITPAESGPWKTERLWHEPGLMKTKFTNAVIHKGYAYGLSDGILECVRLDVKGAERMWKRGRYYHGQILGVGDVLLVMTEKKGDVVMVELTPQQHNELTRFPALDGNQAWNNLALYGPYLLVRDAQQAACYKLPLSGEE